MKAIKFFLWKITHWQDYQKRKFDVFALLTEKMNKQERFRKLLNDFVERNKKIPQQYALAYIAMKKIKKPWYEDKKVIRRLKKTTRLAIRNEVLKNENNS